MGGTIRCLPYLKVPNLSYKYTAYVHHQYDNTVRHRLEDRSDNIFLILQISVETLEQKWLEVSLNLVLFIFRYTC
jgi:hypothetical protein